MRISLVRPAYAMPRIVVAVITLVTVATFGSPAQAADGFSGSLVGELVDTSDMGPLMALDAVGGSAPAAKARSASSSRSGVRQSVPDRDRAALYRSDEVFGYSKVALPLLVVDIESRQLGFDVLPMSGRSVGARPSAAWTRPLSVAAAPTAEPESRFTGAWGSLGR